MANLYTVIPGLQPSQQEIAESELFAKQILESYYPDMDLREGTGIRDLAVRPAAMLLALVRKGLDNFFAQNSIYGVTDSTPTEMVDSILSNLFLDRNLGTRAVISARLYFARKKTVTLTSDIFFSVDNVTRFFPSQAALYSEESLVFDPFNNEYYLDADLTAESEGEEYNIGAGSLLYFANFDPYFLRAEINYLKESSIASETNTKFIDRASTSISTRNLINVPSIDNNIRANFNYIPRITTIGMGDPEMLRDAVRGVIEEDIPRQIEYATMSGGILTVWLADHNYHSGQKIRMSNSTPSTLNGEYTILSVTPGSFNVTSSLVPSNRPFVTYVNDPILIHNGGMVDVYCGEELAVDLVQLTLDDWGKAELIGPIYSFERSSITGGIEDDTLPFREPIEFESVNIQVPNRRVTVTHAVRPFKQGMTLQVGGLEQEIGIQSIDCLGLTVTINMVGFSSSLLPSQVRISGVVPEEYNGVYTITPTTSTGFTYTVPMNIADPGDASNAFVVNDNLNGNYPMQVLNDRTFTFVIPGMWRTGLVKTEDLDLQYEPVFTYKNKYSRTQSFTSITSENGVATVNFADHGQFKDRHITITNANPIEYNGTWKITEVPNKDQFQFHVGVDRLAAAPSPNIQFIHPWNDFGFSTRQSYVVDFGPEYAFKTASFEIRYFDFLEGIQDYLDTPENRVLCGDLLARGFNIHLLDIDVVTYNGPAASAVTISESIQKYLKSLSPGDMIVLSDMVAQLATDGVTNIKTPLGVKYTWYTRDLIEPKTGTIIDYLDPEDRTNMFVLNNVTSTSEAV